MHDMPVYTVYGGAGNNYSGGAWVQHMGTNAHEAAQQYQNYFPQCAAGVDQGPSGAPRDSRMSCGYCQLNNPWGCTLPASCGPLPTASREQAYRGALYPSTTYSARIDSPLRSVNYWRHNK